MDPIREKILKPSKETRQDFVGKTLSYASIFLIVGVVLRSFYLLLQRGSRLLRKIKLV